MRGKELLDRGADLSVLAAALQAAAGGSGRTLVIRGRPGIGKTALLTAAAELAAELGFRRLRARGSELERELAFGVMRQLFEPILAQAAPGERRRLLEGAAKLAEPAVAAAVPREAAADFATMHGLHWLTVNVADEGPLLVSIDDAHWADEPSLRSLAYVARRLEGIAALLVVAVRPGAEDDAQSELYEALAGAPGAAVLSPAPLGVSSVSLLVEGELGQAPDAAFARACHRVTGGNPFLVRELVLELKDRAMAADATRVDLIGQVAPAGVRSSVLRRLSALPDGAKRLARAVAILGEGAELSVALTLARLDADAAGPLAGALADASVLEPGLPLRFVHPLIRSAVAATMTSDERDEANTRAAALLQEAGSAQELVAAHLLHSPPVRKRWAFDVLVAAARRAAARGAYAQASAYFRRSLAEVAPESPGTGLLLELGTAAARAGQPDAVDLLARAASSAAEPEERTRCALALGGTLFALGRFPEAVETYRTALEQQDDGELRWELEGELMNAARQDLATRPLALERLGRIAGEPEPSSRAACKLLANLANEEMAAAGSRERALRLARLSLSGEWLYEDQPPLTFALAGSVLITAGELDHALRVHDEALARARSRGGVVDAAFVGLFRALALNLRGQLADAAADARAAVEAVDAYGAALLAPYAGAFLAYVLVDMGQLDDAEAALEPLAAMAAAPQAFAGAYVLSARGRLRLAQGRLDEAAGDLRECGRRLSAWRVYNPAMAPWQAEDAAAAAAAGRMPEALRGAADALARTRRWGCAWATSEALRVAGSVRGDAALLHEAAEIAAAGRARLAQARALVELGALTRARGTPREARDLLRTGLDLALACGADPLARRAHDELVATGAQPRRLRETGPAALTPAERRTAALAADGLTNRGIAQALFVSEKTVETHLRNTFRKLDLTSRSQLATALAGDTQ